MRLPLIRLATALAACAFTTLAAAPPRDLAARRVAVVQASMLDQKPEHKAVLQAGLVCKLLSEAEVVYWSRTWALASVVVLTEQGLRAKASCACRPKRAS